MKAARAVRAGFTLIELLVVMAIIAVLASLLLVAVMKSWSLVPGVQATSDIGGLHQAVVGFKAQFKGIDYVPSRIMLANKPSDYPVGDPLAQESLSFITRMYPQCVATWNTTGFIWNADSNVNPATLDGHECLVFFLAGPVLNVTTDVTKPTLPLGWAINASDPIDKTNTERKSFYEFNSARLIKRPGRTYYSYLDPWKVMPYAYFSTRRVQNSYTNDCESLTDALNKPIRPYGNGGSFENPKTYQIISAGKDGLWGQQNWMPATGTPWTPATAQNDYPAGNPGADDMSNFYKGKLGNKSQ